MKTRNGVRIRMSIRIGTGVRIMIRIRSGKNIKTRTKTTIKRGYDLEQDEDEGENRDLVWIYGV